MKPAKNKRGGARPGAGRKALESGVESVTVTVRMLPRQRDKLRRLGGGAWIRERIDKARDS